MNCQVHSASLEPDPNKVRKSYLRPGDEGYQKRVRATTKEGRLLEAQANKKRRALKAKFRADKSRLKAARKHARENSSKLPTSVEELDGEDPEGEGEDPDWQ